MELTESFEKTITNNEIERWRYPRFFSRNIAEKAIVIGDDAKHIKQVLRMKKGDKAIICDGCGNDYLCRIDTAESSCIELDILDRCDNQAEASVYLRLFQCMPKSDKMEFIVQKATELGAAEVIPVISKRCVSRPDDKKAVNKIARYQKIADEAAKQCGRGKIPKIGNLISFNEAIKLLPPCSESVLNLLFYECGGEKLSSLITPAIKEINVFIGSEGGFDEAEATLALASGVKIATLGARILRCETAPVASLAILMNLTDNM